jgi:Flp pilus assembly protein TadG
MVALFGFGALSIDVSRYYQQQRDLQSATDAAAMAGAILLTNSSPNVGNITTYATTVALTNGAATNITVQAGIWATNSFGVGNFTANATPYNAVKVYAQRTMPVTFGSVVGALAMTPWANSVVVRSYPSQAEDLIPFFITTNALGSAYGVSQHADKSSGNFGQADLGGSLGYDGGMASGCSCTISVGQTVNGYAGNDHTEDGLADAEGRPVVVPIVDALPSNHGAVTVVGFAVIEIDSVTGNGNWKFTFRVLSNEAGSGTGGPTNQLYATDRVLVQ